MSAEVILAVAVIGLTGLLTQLPPANTASAAATSTVAVPRRAADVVVAQPVLEADGVRGLLTVETKGTDATFDARITDAAGNVRTDVTRVHALAEQRRQGCRAAHRAAHRRRGRALPRDRAMVRHRAELARARRRAAAGCGGGCATPLRAPAAPDRLYRGTVSPNAFLWPRLLPDAWRGHRSLADRPRAARLRPDRPPLAVGGAADDLDRRDQPDRARGDADGVVFRADDAADRAGGPVARDAGYPRAGRRALRAELRRLPRRERRGQSASPARN